MKEHDVTISDLQMDEIESIEFVGDIDTIDIEVEDTHMFFANGIYTKNSSTESAIVSGNMISESFKKIMTADFVMSVSRQLSDKTAGTARIHIIKNRNGKDGQTYNALFNVSIGKLDILDEYTAESQQVQQDFKNNVAVDKLIATVKKNLLDNEIK